ncbi:hypothetical protein E3V93_01795 [Microbacterium sp. 3H14]|uniref:hypothetical protein n=1 Tax=Microbacterium sp. 3H14 TaxID=2555725 RepID=UPI00106CB839|nr:hypothetical protein [Microbacterium sp. 3H14]TFB15440.1 hypothetical protein E3V93_01795 [Microbacterium sp. 3H14]
MVDPVVSIAAAEAAKTGGGVLSRLLGPTADEMGVQLQEWYRRKNVERVARQAEAKASTGTAGSIPPRVAAEVFEKAQWADDDFVAEYLSGVLASSRTPDGTDDRGVAWTALVGRLSADQLRLHYIMYRAFRKLALGLEYEALSDVLQRPLVFQASEIITAMKLSYEVESIYRVLEALYGLSAEGLVGEQFQHGGADFLNKANQDRYDFPGFVGDLFVVYATTRGSTLFLHAHGRGLDWAAAITDPATDLVVDWPDGEEVADVGARWKEDFKIA